MRNFSIAKFDFSPADLILKVLMKKNALCERTFKTIIIQVLVYAPVPC